MNKQIPEHSQQCLNESRPIFCTQFPRLGCEVGIYVALHHAPELSLSGHGVARRAARHADPLSTWTCLQKDKKGWSRPCIAGCHAICAPRISDVLNLPLGFAPFLTCCSFHRCSRDEPLANLKSICYASQACFEAWNNHIKYLCCVVKQSFHIQVALGRGLGKKNFLANGHSHSAMMITLTVDIQNADSLTSTLQSESKTSSQLPKHVCDRKCMSLKNEGQRYINVNHMLLYPRHDPPNASPHAPLFACGLDLLHSRSRTVAQPPPPARWEGIHSTGTCKSPRS